ncbi:MAG: DUF4097 domain-containing protein [Ruminococcaceae bacterium]|nr:DUF4097 domain-containing protein [Oscillospiraceae bacterium]
MAIILIIGILGGFMHILSFFTPILYSNVAGEYKIYEIENEIKFLDIEIHAVNFEIETSNDSNFRVESNYKYLEVREKENKLIIKDKKDFHFSRNSNVVLKLYIPENATFEEVEIKTGAGETNLETLHAKCVDMQFGAGKAILNNVSVSENAFLEAGVGKLIIKDSTFCNLDLDMGVGNLEFTGTLLGRNFLKMGVGSSQINLSGSLDNYSLDIEKGLGDIYVGDDNFIDNTKLGQGDRKVYFEGGIGSVNIDFSD